MAVCPNRATLEALLEEKLSRLIATPLKRHLESCTECQKAAAAVARTLTADRPAFDPECSAGTLLAGRFQLDHVIGYGGVGVVWAAHRLQDRHTVAIKALHQSDPEFTQRLLREARLSAAISHPAFVPIQEVLETPLGRPALVMDLLEGEDLAAHIEHVGQLPSRQALAILASLADAIGALHQQQIAHRDLKPANLFLEDDAGQQRLRVLDLGMARCLDLERHTLQRARLTAEGCVLGTPHFMAPEQLDGSLGVDMRADIWALGAIAYRVLSGRSHIRAWHYADVVRALYTEPMTQLSTLVPQIPQLLGELVHRSLAIDVAQRPSAEVWIDVLHEVQEVRSNDWLAD